MPAEHAFKDVSQSGFEHMKAICNLRGLWRGTANSFGVRPSSIASNECAG